MTPINVLLIDDDETYSIFVERLLERADDDFAMEKAKNYTTGLKIIKEARHDVYLIDFRLGNQSGIDLIREARKFHNTAPFIMITNEVQDNIELESFHVGATDYVRKSEVTSVALGRVIRYALERANFLKNIQESEELYQMLLDEAFEGILLTDLNGKILVANKTICQLTGYTAEELQNTYINQIISGIDKDFKADSINLKSQLFERQLFYKDETKLIDVEVNIRPTRDNIIQITIRDISRHKQAVEDHKRHIEQLTILHQVDDELSQTLSEDYVLSMALDAGIRLSGADTGFIGLFENDKIQIAQAVGRYAKIEVAEDFSKIPHMQQAVDDRQSLLISDKDDDGTAYAQMVLPLIASEQMIGLMELETNKIERFNEEIFEFLQLITARLSVAIENARLYRVSQQQLQELQSLYKQVSNLEKLKTDMIRIASHDLRNPIGIILGYLKLLNRVLPQDVLPHVHEYIAQIDQSARHAEAIISDILSMERIENMQEVSKDIIDLIALVKQEYAVFEKQAKEKEHTISLNIQNEIIQIQGDEAQMREALGNLISNAIKYTQDGGIIQVNLYTGDQYAIFTVVDNGFGVPEEYHEKLFSPFFRAKSRETQDIQGTGLGLHLIKRIIERFDGEIMFESVYGEGSTFGFKLPTI